MTSNKAIITLRYYFFPILSFFSCHSLGSYPTISLGGMHLAKERMKKSSDHSRPLLNVTHREHEVIDKGLVLLCCA